MPIEFTHDVYKNTKYLIDFKSYNMINNNIWFNSDNKFEYQRTNDVQWIFFKENKNFSKHLLDTNDNQLYKINAFTNRRRYELTLVV